MKSLSRVRLFATPWTVAYQAPLSMGFSRQVYWSGLPFPSPGDLPNPGLPHCRQTLYRLSHQGSPNRRGGRSIRKTRMVAQTKKTASALQNIGGKCTGLRGTQAVKWTELGAGHET